MTGDSSGDFLFSALYRAGFANCRPYLQRKFELLPNVRVLIGLGQIGLNAALDVLQALVSLESADGAAKTQGQAHGVELPRPRPKFGHNVCYRIGPYTVIGTYHASRQNTNTGKLTRAMFDAVFKRAQKELGRI